MKENSKALLKKTLIFLSFFLGVILIITLAYGIFIERTIAINIEKSNGQIKIIDLDLKMDQKEIQEEKKKEELDQAIKEVTKKDSTHPENELQTPKVAIIVTNLGTNKNITEAALSLPQKITLGFSAYTTDLKIFFNKAISVGYDVLVYLPFAPQDYPISDPGPYAILSTNLPEKNISITRAILDSFPGASGIYGDYRESLSSNQQVFTPILDFLASRDMMVVLGRTTAGDTSNYLANKPNVFGSDIVIDIIPDAMAIKHSLSNLVATAKKNGHAIGYMNTYPISLKTLTSWLASPESGEVEIVPLSKISIKRP